MRPRSDYKSEIARLMASDHAQLEQLFQRVMACLRGADPEQLRARWLELDHALERHLAIEEELFLPRFERDHPTSAARVRSEHRQIRAALVQLGIDLDLHELCPASAAQFIKALRVHATSEDALLYPWAAQHLGEEGRIFVLNRLHFLRGPRAATESGERSQHS